MAMEVTSKNLHRHAVPIGLVLVAVMIISVVAIYGSSVAGGLTTQVITIHPGSNGLAKISKTEPRPIDLSDAGHAAALSLSLNGAGGESRTPVTSLEN